MNHYFGVSLGLLFGVMVACTATANTTETNSFTDFEHLGAVPPAGNNQVVVALDGDTLVVGSPYADLSGGLVQAGRAYVYLRTGMNWTKQAELTPGPDDRGAFDQFGGAVAVSGDKVVVGSRRNNDDRGAAYVFVRSGSAWDSGTKLTVAGGTPGHYFGTAVAISAGDTVVVGAGGANAGHVYTWNGSTWTHAALLGASGGSAASDGFGCSAAVTSADSVIGYSALIGAPGRTVSGLANAGVAYLFKGSDFNWSSSTQTLLSAASSNANAYLGYAVDLHRGVALIGAPGKTVSALANAGAGYVSYSNGGAWSALEQPPTMVGAAAGNSLGTSVNLGGDQADVALLGAPGAQSALGAAYLFIRDGVAASGAPWSASAGNALLASNATLPAPGDRLGASVALFGDTAIAVAPTLGAVYAYRFDCGFGRYWPPATWLFPSLPCVASGTPTVSGIFSNQGSRTDANYGSSSTSKWYMYQWTVSSQSLAGMALSAPITQGGGYELNTQFGGRIGYTRSAATPLVTTPAPYCAAGCFAITVTPPATPGSAQTANLIGHPFPYPVDWADVRIHDVTTNTVYTPSAANTANIFNKSFRRWNGSANLTYDDSTPGMNGNLLPNESFWVWVKPGASGHTIKLLIPALPSRQNAAAPATDLPKVAMLEQLLGPVSAWQPSAERLPVALLDRLLGRVSAVLEGIVDRLIPSAMAAPPAEHEARDMRGQKHGDAIGRGEEWYVRLIVQSADGRYADPGHVLGQLADADDRWDAYDVEALEVPMPPGVPTLSLVFAHPEWKKEAADYASDYHALKKNKDDSWNFEVRSNQRGTFRLRWESTSADALALGQLLDQETGAVINVAGADHYDFVLNKAQRAFSWYYLGKSGPHK